MTEEKWLATLSTTEPYNNIGLIKLRRNNENSEVMRVRLTKNSKLYDLTALKVFFVTHFIGKDSLNVPVQKEATIINAKEGIVEFIFDQDCMQKVGRQEAYFEIYDYDKFLDATQNFTYEIISSSRDVKADFSPYIETWEILEKLLGDKPVFALQQQIEELKLKKVETFYFEEVISDIVKDLANKADNNSTTEELKKKANKEDVSNQIIELEKQIANAQSGIIGVYKTETELKDAHPGGKKGFAIVLKADGTQDYAYTWNGKEWKRGWPVSENQMTVFFEELKIDSDGTLYTSPKKAIDMQDGKRVSRLNYLSNEVAKISNGIDLEMRPGHIDEITGIVPKAAYSDRIYSKRVELNDGEVLVLEPSNNVSGLLFLYNGDKFVRNSGYFTSKFYQTKDDSFTHVIITAGYRTQEIIDTKDKMEKISSLFYVEKINKRSVYQRVKDDEIETGISYIKFEYGKVRNVDVGYGNKVEKKATNNGQWKTSLVDCSEGEVFLLNGTGGVNPRLWSFIDENDKLIATSKSSLLAKGLYIIVPARAKKMIVNSVTDEACYKINIEKYSKEITISDDSMSVGTIETGETNLGDVVTTSPKYNLSYACTIIPITKTNKIIVEGAGGLVPRLWAYLDSDFRLLDIADKETTSIRTKKVIYKPENVKYVVINSNLAIHNITMKINYRTVRNLSVLENEDSLLQRKVPSTVVLTDFINGIKLSDELRNPIFDFNMPGDKMLHSGSFRIIDDVVYAAMYINKIGVDEKETQHTSVLRVRKLDGTDETKNLTICDIGDELFGKRVTALYDTVVIDELGDLRVLFVAKLENEWYQLFRIYNLETNSLSQVYKMEFSYKGFKDEFSITGMTNVLKANNIYYPFLNRHPNFLSTVSSRIENGEKYWYIGLGMKDFCFIAKTKDFIDIEYVSQPTFEHTPQYEASVYVLGDEIFYFERQEMWEFTPYSILSKYNLITGEWDEPVKIVDTQSRSDFIFYNKKLYLIHAPFDRNHIAITEINTKVLEMSFTLATAYVDDLFFPFVKEYNNKIYMIATKGRKYMNFAEFTIPKFEIGDTVELFKKLVNL